MHFCACVHMHTLGLQRVEMLFLTSSSGQEHHLTGKKNTIIPLPKYIFLQSAFLIWKVYLFSVKDVNTS